MRFLENGPSIPDELLAARDEGRVVFFCGSGVSAAKANLPDFFGLADAVIKNLGTSSSSPIYTVLEEFKNISKRTGVSGLVGVDRIFGMLERDFTIKDIEIAVAQALKPMSCVNLKAHQTLLDLATTPEGKIRLVTTNFDRLFDDCKTVSSTMIPPRLPDPTKHDEFDGIIYLHGCCKKDYSAAEDGGFVLTSSSFGNAYLAEGWATAFIRDIINRYVIVFVGYSADDPPMQYLLEALNRNKGIKKELYAFQSGEPAETAAQWRPKGVKAISYENNDRHQNLWDTLGAWAERANAIDDWYDSVLEMATKGPEKLKPYERGQVTHIVSTLDGTRRFMKYQPTLPGTWLCVFDPAIRYSMPGHKWGNLNDEEIVDPFDYYSIDSDVVIDSSELDKFYRKRSVPDYAWSAFDAAKLDRDHLRDGHFPAIGGFRATMVPTLAPRLEMIGSWMSSVCTQPIVIWWAAGINGLHPDIQYKIKRVLSNSEKIPKIIYQAWQHIFEGGAEKEYELRHARFQLQEDIKKYGWDSQIVRRYGAVKRPYLSIRRNNYDRPLPSECNSELRISDMLVLDVNYPTQYREIPIPDEWLSKVIQELRLNLEYSQQLLIEITGHRPTLISPIHEDNDPDINHDMRERGLAGYVISIKSLMQRLIAIDISAARNEILSWPVFADTVFTRLRIWACSIPELIPENEYSAIILGMSDDVFWDPYNRRDLLLVLASRWNKVGVETRTCIENRIRAGFKTSDDASNNDTEYLLARSILNRIHWLYQHGCNFSFDLETETRKLKLLAPDWNPKQAEGGAKSLEVRTGWVGKDIDHSSLLDIPLNKVLTKAREINKNQGFRKSKDPYAGLARTHPLRALSTLTVATKKKEYPEWAWRTFLYSDSRKEDKSKFMALIAERLYQCPDANIASFIRPASDWLNKVVEKLSAEYPNSYGKIVHKLIAVLNEYPDVGTSALVRTKKEIDWLEESINSPTGVIAQTLLKEARVTTVQKQKKLPIDWLNDIQSLLALSEDQNRYALVIFSYRLVWFYFYDHEWTERHLISALEGDQETQDAFWHGFLRGPAEFHPELFKSIKTKIIIQTKANKLSKTGLSEGLCGILLTGWLSKDDGDQGTYVSSDELRDTLIKADEKIRLAMLQVIRNTIKRERKESIKIISDKVISFFQSVWPRQKEVKSPLVSEKIFSIVFSDKNNFSKIAELTLPFLCPCDGIHIDLPRIKVEKENLVDLYPLQILSILDVILPNDISYWPWNIEEYLDRIGNASAILRHDSRLIELKRKWNSR
jgi:hypothetical protein